MGRWFNSKNTKQKPIPIAVPAGPLDLSLTYMRGSIVEAKEVPLGEEPKPFLVLATFLKKGKKKQKFRGRWEQLHPESVPSENEIAKEGEGRYRALVRRVAKKREEGMDVWYPVQTGEWCQIVDPVHFAIVDTVGWTSFGDVMEAEG